MRLTSPAPPATSGLIAERARMIPFPDISPNLFAFELFGREIALRWYALAYMAGLLYGWWIILRAIRTPRLWADKPPLTAEQVERFFTWAVVTWLDPP